MLTQNSNGIDVEFDFVLLLSVCRQSVHADNRFAICKMACCMENMSTMKKKKKSCCKQLRCWTPKRANLTNHLHQSFYQGPLLFFLKV